MLPDTELIVHHFPERKDIRIYAVSDVHLGAAEHMTSEWESFCERVQDEDAYLIIGGDLLNNCTRSSVSDIFKEVMTPGEAKKRMTEMLDPLREKILAIVPGNHERRNKDVNNCPAYDIACKLDIEDRYRENAAFIKIQIGNPNYDGSRNPTYIITVIHGSGGGALTGGVVNKAERFAYAIDGDALILGHSHKPFVTQPCKIKIDPQHNKVSFKPFKVISMTSWMNWGGYAAQKMLTPTSFAPQVMTLRGKRKEIVVEM